MAALGSATSGGERTVLATSPPRGRLPSSANAAAAAGLAEAVAEPDGWRTLVVIGGDTAAAILGAGTGGRDQQDDERSEEASHWEELRHSVL